MCKCTPEIRTPFCGRGDCLPPGFANLSEWLGEQEAAAQMSLDRGEQAVQQAMEGRKTDPAQAALNWAHNYATKHQPRGSDSDADIAHLIVEQTKLIAELTIENGQLHIQLDRDEWPGLRQQLRQAEAHGIDMQEAYKEQYNRAEGYRTALEDCIEALNVEDNRLRRQYPDPDFAHMVQSLGERIGYGVVMTEASRLWFEKAGSGAFSVGHCIVIQESAWEAARAALEETR